MKTFLKRNARILLKQIGLYEKTGLIVAKIIAMPLGIVISKTIKNDYFITNKSGEKIFLNKRHVIYLSEFVKYFKFYYSSTKENNNREVHFEQPGWHTPPRWGRPLFFTSFVESEETVDLYLSLSDLKPENTVVDIGAYCGLTSLAFAEKVGSSGHVYAFEPDPENFQALQTNINKYSINNITIENAAVWKTNGTVAFQSEGTISSTIQILAARENATVTVKTINLSDYILKKNIIKIDVIKIDVEGAELGILDSSRDILEKMHPRIILETHMVHDVMTTNDCKRLLIELGYTVTEFVQMDTNCPLLVADYNKKI